MSFDEYGEQPVGRELVVEQAVALASNDDTADECACLGGVGAELISVQTRVDDDQAADFGATIMKALRDLLYGECQYTALDPWGHRWTFSQSIADLAPEDWGATSGPGIHC